VLFGVAVSGEVLFEVAQELATLLDFAAGTCGERRGARVEGALRFGAAVVLVQRLGERGELAATEGVSNFVAISRRGVRG
jgi:hypothetical protein